jgi:hypothetical protein
MGASRDSVAAGQVVTRLDLAWEGHEPTELERPLPEQGQGRSACRTLLVFVAIYVALRCLGFPITRPYSLFNGLFAPDLVENMLWVVGVVLLRKEPSVRRGMVTVFVLVCVKWACRVCVLLFSPSPENVGLAAYVAGWLLDLHIYEFSTAGAMAIRNVRQHVRTKYAIPPVIFATKRAQVPSCDDCFAAVCCPSCATAQLVGDLTTC